jgi:hypothetical protein
MGDRAPAPPADGAHLDPGGPSRAHEAEIFEYFSEEVLAAEPPRRARSSSPRRSRRRSTPRSPRTRSSAPRPRELEKLRERRLFLSRLDGPGDLHAFDPLFRDFLLGKLRAERGERGVALLARAFGLAYARRGDDLQALSYLRRPRRRRRLDLLRTRGRALLRAGSLDAVREAATASGPAPSSRTSSGRRAGCGATSPPPCVTSRPRSRPPRRFRVSPTRCSGWARWTARRRSRRRHWRSPGAIRDSRRASSTRSRSCVTGPIASTRRSPAGRRPWRGRARRATST